MADRLITINIRKYLSTQPRTKRARKAVRYVRERVSHFTKIKPDNIKLGYDLNNMIFKDYSRTMRPLKVRVKIGTDTADVLPYKEESAQQSQQQGQVQQKPAKGEKKPLLKIKKQQEPKQEQAKGEPVKEFEETKETQHQAHSKSAHQQKPKQAEKPKAD